MAGVADDGVIYDWQWLWKYFMLATTRWGLGARVKINRVTESECFTAAHQIHGTTFGCNLLFDLWGGLFSPLINGILKCSDKLFD